MFPPGLTDAIKPTDNDSKGTAKINGRESDRFSIKKGVKQDYNMSPLFFIIYMDEILKICKRSTALTINREVEYKDNPDPRNGYSLIPKRTAYSNPKLNGKMSWKGNKCP